VPGCSRSVGFRNRAATTFFQPRIGYEWKQFRGESHNRSMSDGRTSFGG
jgi:hypothetical protein